MGEKVEVGAAMAAFLCFLSVDCTKERDRRRRWVGPKRKGEFVPKRGKIGSGRFYLFSEILFLF